MSALKRCNGSDHLVDVRIAPGWCAKVIARILSRARPRLAAVKKRAILNGALDFRFEEMPVAKRSVLVKIATYGGPYLRSDMPFEADRHQVSSPSRAKSDRIEIGTTGNGVAVCLESGLLV